MATLAMSPGKVPGPSSCQLPRCVPSLEGVLGVSSNSLCPDLPIIDLSRFLEDPDGAQDLCSAVATCLHTASAVVVRDPRIQPSDNEQFLDLMEDYFAQPLEAKMADVRPDLGYQVGATPGGTERPRCLRDSGILQTAERNLLPEHRPAAPEGPDPKWRFFWRLGEWPEQTAFKELNAKPVVPAGFPEWERVMDRWGGALLGTVQTVASMAARGLGLPVDAFTARMHAGPHLLAPTGADLGGEHGPAPGAVLAGYHYDLNFLTAHGAARYPGLAAWLRSGRRVRVRVPPGCILLQAGRQLEWLTGGHIRAGFHEVLCDAEALATAARATAAGRPPWRVSSTVFSQIASDVTLCPLGRFAGTPGSAQAYPPTLAGVQVQQELAAINLAGTTGMG